MSSVVGVDFGCQNSVIAAAGRGGVDVILNGNSNRLNPSLVGFDDCRKMGEVALSGASSNFKFTVQAMKRLVGLGFDDPVAQAEMKRFSYLSFRRVKANSAQNSSAIDTIGVETSKDPDHSRVVSIEGICGMFLKHMGTIAAEKAAQESNTTPDKTFPQDWVVTVPAYFTDSQRRGLLKAADIAGIAVQRLLHESTATALAYGIFKDLKKEFTAEKPTNVMFIDMGASQYNVSICSFVPGKLIVKSSHGDANLGGRDFDWLIASHIAQEFKNKFGPKLSVDPLERPKTVLKLLAAAEKAKKTLSPQGVKEARINLEMLQDDLDFNLALTADTYEKMCQPLLDRLGGPIGAALAEAKLQVADLASVEIVGGSTRIGCVKRKMVELLGGKITLSTTLNADEAVSRGAALQSAILSPRFKVLPYDIQEAQPYPIQVRWDDDAASMEVDTNGEAAPTNLVTMFDRGLSFPIVRRVTLKREGKFSVYAEYTDGAKSFGLPEGTNKSIATFSIAAPAGGEKKVRVNVKQDISGVISLSSAQMVEEIVEEGGDEAAAAAAGADEAKEGEAEKKKKTKKTNLEFSQSRPIDWTAEWTAAAQAEEASMTATDKLVQETADMRNELESYIYDMRDKVGSDSRLGSYGTDAEKAAFTTLNEATENWLYEDGFDATKEVYSEKLAALRKLGGPMERRLVEQEGRANAVSALQTSLDSYKTWVNNAQTDEKLAHITDAERQQVHDKCDTVSAWMYEMLDKQGSLASHEDPALTMGDLQAKQRELADTCGPIMRKPVPKPKKEDKKEEKKETPAAAEGAAKEDPPAAEPMDVDEGAKKEDGAMETE